MGRNSTGTWTTGQCLRIELSYLLKARYLVRGAVTSGALSWNYNGHPSGNISIVCSGPTEPGKRATIRLMYAITTIATGEQEKHDHTIYLESRPSNLGKGEVLYFVCPVSGQLCRILYKGYDSPIWKSRQSYQNRIYYPTQKSSKREYANNRYWELDSQINKIQGRRKAGTYRGKPTKRAERIKYLQTQQWECDHQRWLPEAMTLGMRRAVFGGIPGFEYVNKSEKMKLNNFTVNVTLPALSLTIEVVFLQ